MKALRSFRLIAFVLLTLTVVRADDFPGLKVIMTADDYARAGLDRLTPDQIHVINAALIRHFRANVSVAAERKAAEQVTTTPAHTAAVAPERKRSGLDRFGLPLFNGDWKNEPILKARATGWVGGNSFALDNGQVWEGLEPITVELVGREVEIQPRPAGAYALNVEGKNTTLRVRRVK
jgi:hypothetical protein